MNIPERLPNSIDGLKKMIIWLGHHYNIKEMTIVEIGSWTGLSTIEFAKNFKHVICIDPWEATGGINTKYSMKQVEKIFDDRTKDFYNITKIKARNETLFKEDENGNILLNNFIKDIDSLDMIYIDGLHTYEAVKQDIINWYPLIKYCICGHDYWLSKFPGVIKAVNEVLGRPDMLFSDTSFIKVVKSEN